jgi:hypothetical protein
MIDSRILFEAGLTLTGKGRMLTMHGYFQSTSLVSCGLLPPISFSK